MALSTGTRLGPFEVIGSLGAGGMGEVYRATDTSLGRDVAIKVLPEAVAQDAERLARFDREARTLAALNHPNIAQIHGLEKSDGQTALVMELVEGPTMADRIAQGPIPVDEALPIAKQIAEALEAAHEQGIIHRDLKPANIKLRHDGMVKVLDFGLAKAMEPAAAASPSASMSPTITSPAMTQAGIILGTAAYMSPEQARGKPVDKRADIWAFGCVLYEMLTGQRAFEGEDVAMTFAEIMKSEPKRALLPTSVPRGVRQALSLCLQKDPRRRVGDVAAVMLALDGALEPPGTVPVDEPSGVRLARLAGLLLVVGLVAVALGWSLSPRPDAATLTRFSYPVAGTGVISRNDSPVLTVAPDGRAFAYNGSDGLFLRTLDALDARLVPNTGGGRSSPVFSPTGDAIAYWASGQLRRISLNGGTPITVANVPEAPSGISWSEDNTILVGQSGGILRISASGGTPELVVAAAPGERVHGPQLLPDGSVMFSTTTGDWSQARVVVQSLDTDERTVVLEQGSEARYIPPGYLLYASGDSLLGVEFDLDTLAVSSDAVVVASGLMRATTTSQRGVAHYSVSASGLLVYASVDGDSERTLVWVGRDGQQEPTGLAPGPYAIPRLSPDGSQVALQADGDIWLYTFQRGVLDRVTSEPGDDRDVIWSPDGESLAYYAEGREGGAGIFRRRPDGTGEIQRLSSGTLQLPQAWSADGEQIVFVYLGDPVGRDLGVVAANGMGTPAPLFESPASEDAAKTSPDGRWVAFETFETGTSEVSVRPFPDVDAGEWRISRAGGFDPVWSPDGSSLYYREEQSIVEVRVDGADPSRWGRPTPLLLLDDTFVFANGPTHFDVGPDGRFLMLKYSEPNPSASAAPGIVVVTNWQRALESLASPN